LADKGDTDVKKLCLPLVLCCVVGCYPVWQVTASPFGNAHREVGAERTADVLSFIGAAGVISLGVAVIGYGVDPAARGDAEEFREWPGTVAIVAMGLVTGSCMFDWIHAPMVARRDAGRIRLAVGPDRVVLVCEF
jgi:hypothetical protein